jgi:hypothetical protein
LVTDYVLAEKEYDSDEFLEVGAWSGAEAVTSPQCNRQAQREFQKRKPYRYATQQTQTK